MSTLDKLESQLDEWLNKKAPISLPAVSRKNLAGAFWWLALVFGVLQLWAASALWHLGHLVNQLVTYSNYLSSTYGYGSTAPSLGLFYWVSLITLAADAILLLVAAPQLKQMKKSGWNLLFYGALLNAAYAVFRIFSNVGGGFSGFIGAAIGAVLGAYFLFQVRDYFVSAAKAMHATTPAPQHKAKH
jgi:hypothetical protein